MPRSEGPFDRLLKRRPERDPAPIIIGGTIAFLAVIIVIVLLFSSVFGGGGDGGNGGSSAGDGTIDIAPGIRGRRAQIPALPPGLASLSEYIEFQAEGTPAHHRPASHRRPVRRRGPRLLPHFDDRWQRLADVSVRELGEDGG
jgi:hypothetical protein